jgi:murein L,D-transpeptidase YcbB/YkuD
MRKLIVTTGIIISLFLLTLVSCKKNEAAASPTDIKTTFDSSLVKTFFTEHPLIKNYQSEIEQLYLEYYYVWHDKNGINEFATVLYNKFNSLKEKSILNIVPYLEKLDLVYDNLEDNDKDWHKEKIETAMSNGEENCYTLKNKIPVYIGCFTAWVDPEGTIYFYGEFYNKDEALADLI